MTRKRKQRSTSARGYGAVHQARRKRLAPIVAKGLTRCARCGELIAPGEPWELDHEDERRPDGSRDYLGVSHKHCNRSAASKRAAENRRPRVSRDW